MTSVTTGGAIVAYGQWALNSQTAVLGGPWAALTLGVYAS